MVDTTFDSGVYEGDKLKEYQQVLMMVMAEA